MKNPNRTKYITAAVLFSIFSVMGAFSQEEVETVEDSAFEKLMRPVAGFMHDEHNETAEIDECFVCHHMYEDEKLVEDESSEEMECSECHTIEGGNPFPLIKVYHQNCKGCHKKYNKKNKTKAAPTTCSKCHPEKKK